jgi:WD40 repeat protein
MKLVSGSLVEVPPVLYEKWIFLVTGTSITQHDIFDMRIVLSASHESRIITVHITHDEVLLYVLANGTVVMRPLRSLRTPSYHSIGVSIQKASLCDTGIVAVSFANTLLYIPILNKNLGTVVELTSGSPVVVQISSNFVFCSFGSRLFVYSIRHKQTREVRHVRNLTHISVHPDEDHVATGDSAGIIARWWILNDAFWVAQSTRFEGTVQHWHSSAITSIEFSDDGSVLYSGGDEGVLCCWHGVSQKRPQFLPRLGSSAIQCISIKSNICAVGLSDNTIAIIDLYRLAVRNTFSGAPFNLISCVSDPVTPGKLHIATPESVSSINASTGSRGNEKINLFNRNYIGKKWNKFVENQRSSSARLVASIDNYKAVVCYRASPVQAQLKFYLGSTLQSVCSEAHASQITGICALSRASNHFFATSSTDGSIKVWAMSIDDTWKCIKVLRYKSQPATAIAYKDGVLFACFGVNLLAYDIDSFAEITGGLFVGGVGEEICISESQILLRTTNKIVCVNLVTMELLNLDGFYSSITKFKRGFAATTEKHIHIFNNKNELDDLIESEVDLKRAISDAQDELYVLTVEDSVFKVFASSESKASEDFAGMDITLTRENQRSIPSEFNADTSDNFESRKRLNMISLKLLRHTNHISTQDVLTTFLRELVVS